MRLEILWLLSQLIELDAPVKHCIQVGFHVSHDVVQVVFDHSQFATTALLLICQVFLQPNFVGNLLHLDSKTLAKLFELKAVAAVLDD